MTDTARRLCVLRSIADENRAQMRFNTGLMRRGEAFFGKYLLRAAQELPK
jgi:hypothetical protein